MGFRRSDLQEALFVPGTHAFRMWGYGTTDPLDEVLAPGYFAAASGMLRPGELIYVSVRPPATPARGTAPGEAQMALVMVRAREPHCETADGSLRLGWRAVEVLDALPADWKPREAGEPARR